MRTRSPFIPIVTTALLLAAAPARGINARQEPDDGARRQALSAESDTSNSIKPGAALLRSAVYPGWGQIYTEHPVKGGLMIVLQTAFIGMAISADAKVKDLVVLRSIDPVPPTLADDIESWRTERRTWILRAFGLWLYSMADAYVDAHLHNFDEVEPTFDVEVDPPGLSRTGAGIRLQLKIPIFR
jgi:hypothetical protein